MFQESVGANGVGQGRPCGGINRLRQGGGHLETQEIRDSAAEQRLQAQTWKIKEGKKRAGEHFIWNIGQQHDVGPMPKRGIATF